MSECWSSKECKECMVSDVFFAKTVEVRLEGNTSMSYWHPPSVLTKCG